MGLTKVEMNDSSMDVVWMSRYLTIVVDEVKNEDAIVCRATRSGTYRNKRHATPPAVNCQ